jgi:hypothetical protein
LIMAQQARLHVNRALLGRSFRGFFEEDRAHWRLLEKEVESLRARYRVWRGKPGWQLIEARESLAREISSRGGKMARADGFPRARSCGVALGV